MRSVLLRLSLISLFIMCCSCSSTKDSGAYLLPRGKQKHTVSVFDRNGMEVSESQAFAIIGEEQAQFTSLSPLGLTLIKAELKKNEEHPAVTYLNPVLLPQEKILRELLRRLNVLFWQRGEAGKGVRVLKVFDDLSAQSLEWTLAETRIVIEVERL